VMLVLYSARYRKTLTDSPGSGLCRFAGEGESVPLRASKNRLSRQGVHPRWLDALSLRIAGHDYLTPLLGIGQGDVRISTGCQPRQPCSPKRTCVGTPKLGHSHWPTTSNEYMDTIGSWSSNVSSFYTYYYC